MRNHLVVLAGASLVLGGMLMLSVRADDPDTGYAKREKGGATQPATKPTAGLPEGITPRDLKEAKDISKQLAKLTEAFLSNNGLGDLQGYFVTYDKDRLAKFVSDHKGDLNGSIAAFKQGWKEKYGQDFNIREYALAFPENTVTVMQGEITNPAMLSNWPVDPTQGQMIPRERSGDEHGQKLDKGRNVAVVHFPAEWGQPELNVSMIHEAIDSWRVDVPDNLTGEKLLQNLKDHLFAAGQAKDQWPANVNDAYRLVCHHLLMALYDVPMGGGGMRGMNH